MFDPRQPGTLSHPITTGIYHHPTSGKAYLVRQQPDGQINFLPLDNILNQTVQYQPQYAPGTPQATQQRHDPLALLGMAIACVLGIAFFAYLVGFAAGGKGQQTVVVPRSPVCDTSRSGFLGFWSERKECQ